MTSKQLLPAIIIPLLAWRLYARARRNIGRQPFQPRRLMARIVIFSVICLLIGFFATAFLPSLVALVGGLLLGAPLAWFGLRLTKFEDTPAGRFYTPNTAIGVALITLFAGRMAYRLYFLFANPPTDGAPPPQIFQSPLTMIIFGLTAGYYIAYSAGVLIRSRRPAA